MEITNKKNYFKVNVFVIITERLYLISILIYEKKKMLNLQFKLYYLYPKKILLKKK